MSTDFRVELHSRGCSCRGGTWAVLGGAQPARCSDTSPAKEVADLEAWKSLGKPACLEDYREAVERRSLGERREFQRYHAEIPVRLSRLPSWRAPQPPTEECVTEVIARGGAMVRTHLAVTGGETLVLEAGRYKSRAEVGYVNAVAEEDSGYLRVGLRFLDAPFPDELIPKDAEPV